MSGIIYFGERFCCVSLKKARRDRAGERVMIVRANDLHYHGTLNGFLQR
ncbi:MAG: hypothetical protein H6626_01110 [Pseudobdellovibrionaceae bacterium]|nr:hypothetical protein [Bdellovibrionales bacterium]USN47722.1 MAG: hypothetical protein H6626_01110 [Pseudobdellovibrionaceae bacterium]